MRNYLNRLTVVIIAVLLSAACLSAQSTIFDRFGIIAEHGLHGSVPEENIDLFTGNLTLKFQDLNLPGPHGLDVTVWRVYNSKVLRDRLPGSAWGIQQEPYSWVGLGWSLHCGRLHAFTTDQPVIEFPDGRWETAYHDINDYNKFVTRGFLKYDPQTYTLYFLDGTKWVFGTQKVVEYLTGNETVRVVTKIVNTYGQEINFTYYESTANIHYIDDSCGRKVTFNVDNATATRQKLVNMTAPPNGSPEGSVYYYSVGSFTNGVAYFRLDNYQPPALNPSFYEYSENGANSHWELTAVNTSYGGRMEYAYADQPFYIYLNSLASRVVSQKKLSTSGVSGTWTYTYPTYKNATEGTVHVSGPTTELNESVTYYAYDNNAKWQIGLLKRRAYDDGSSAEDYLWAAQQISNTQWVVLGVNLGPIFATLKSKVTTSRIGDATAVEVYAYNRANVKRYGLPTSINYLGGAGGSQAKYTVDLTYAFEDSPDFLTRYILSPLSVEDTRAKVTRTSYYSDGAVASITRDGTGGGARTWSYSEPGSDAGQYIVDVTLPGRPGRIDKYIYTWGVLSKVQHPTYIEVTRTIDQNTGWVKDETNQHNGKLIFAYDGIGRITKVTMPAGFNPVNAVWYQNNVTITQGAYTLTKYWDGLGRDLGHTESGGGVTLYYRKSLDAGGRVVSENKGSTSAGDLYQYVLNGLGRPTRVTDPLGKVTAITYSGNQKTVKNANGNSWVYTYNDLPGKATKTKEPNAVETNHIYDTIGRLTSAVTGGARTQSFTYDCQDHITSESHPETGAIGRSYNTENNLGSVSWGGATLSYTYNNSDQVLTTTISGSNETVTNTYDTLGRVSGVTSTTGWARTGMTYNPLGALLGETHTIPGLASKTVGYGYDANNNPASVTYPDNYTLALVNNGLNLPTKATFGQGVVADYATYGHSRQLTGVSLGNSAAYAATYNAAGYLVGAALTRGGTTLYGAAYGYDGVGNVTTVSGTTPRLDGTFTYDKLNRLASAGYTPAGTGVVDRFDYAYDNYGNVTQVKENNTAVFTPTLNAKNQITSAGYAWDARGNLTARPRGRAADTYTWDGANRLLMAQESGGRYTENFLYDERGLRLKKWAAATSCIPAQDDYTTYYVYGQGGQALAEYDAGGRCLRDYVYLGGMLVAEWQPLKSRFLYYTNDPIRSVRLVTDPSGKVVWSAAYAPFGRMEKVWTREYNSPLKYSGKERDELLGLDYFGARYYAFALYRFNCTDPVLNVNAAVENPQKWNRYGYCWNNPLNCIDSNGLLTVHIWRFRGKSEAWGHASMTLDDADHTHISWWPQAEGRERSKLASSVYEVNAYDDQTLAKDIDYEGQNPDREIRIVGLNEKAIKEWWEKFRKTEKWKTLSENCSTAVAEGLKAGGADVDWGDIGKAHHIVWSPNDVEKFSDAINRKLKTPSK